MDLSLYWGFYPIVLGLTMLVYLPLSIYFRATEKVNGIQRITYFFSKEYSDWRNRVNKPNLIILMQVSIICFFIELLVGVVYLIVN